MDDEGSVTSTEYSQDTVDDQTLTVRSKKDTAATLPDTETKAEADNKVGDNLAEMKLLKEIVMESGASSEEKQPVTSAPASIKKAATQRLEDVLRLQLHTRPKTDRATQTNWDWRLMAERWRHARIIQARTLPMELTDLRDHLLALKMKSIMHGEDYLQDELKGSESTDEWLRRVWRQKRLDILEILRSVRECDKITDTAGLDMNPGDSAMSRNQARLSGRSLKGDSKTDFRSVRLHSIRSVGGDRPRHSVYQRRKSHAKSSLSPELAAVREQLMAADTWRASQTHDSGSRKHSQATTERKSYQTQRGSRADSYGGDRRRRSQSSEKASGRKSRRRPILGEEAEGALYLRADEIRKGPTRRKRASVTNIPWIWTVRSEKLNEMSADDVNRQYYYFFVCEVIPRFTYDVNVNKRQAYSLR